MYKSIESIFQIIFGISPIVHHVTVQNVIIPLISLVVVVVLGIFLKGGCKRFEIEHIYISGITLSIMKVEIICFE